MFRKQSWLVCMAIAVVFGCKPLSITYKSLPPQIPIQDSAKSILLIDAADINVPGLMITKKREAVVTSLAKNYVSLLQQQVTNKLPIKPVSDSTIGSDVIESLLQQNSDTANALLAKYQAGIIVLLQSHDAGFTQDEVVKTTNTDGSSSKTAFYSLYFQTAAIVFQAGEWYSKNINVSRPHSKRSVVSGLLARGPGYEANKKDISETMQLNIEKMCELFMYTKQPVYTRQ